MGKTTDEGKKKRSRPSGSEGSARSNKEDGRLPEEAFASAMQDKSPQLRSKESPLIKKVRTDEQNVNNTPEATEKSEEKTIKVLTMHDSTDSKKKSKSSPGVGNLRFYVESLGGMLEDGWQVESHRTHGGGRLTKTFISPSNDKFRSRVEVAKHLGLSPNLSKKGEPHLGNEIVPLQMDGDKDEQQGIATDGHASLRGHPKRGAKSKLQENNVAEGSVQRKEHGSNLPSLQEEAAMKINNGVSSTANPFNAFGDPAASIVTKRCQDVLRSIISTESFASLNNILNRGSQTGSIESSLPLKALPGSIDLQLIRLRLSNGVYGLTPELFSADINQVWKNIITIGKEQVALAQYLSEFSDNLYKQQIMSLFQQPASKEVSERREQFASQHGKQSIEDSVLSLNDSHVLEDNPPQKGTAMKDNKGNSVVEKKSSTQSHRSKQQPKKAAKSKKPSVFKVKIADKKIPGTCKCCGLEQGADCIVCKHCGAAFHTHCMDLPSNNLQEEEWFCPDCVGKENESKEKLAPKSDEITKELCQTTGITGVCEKCKKEDDNVLICNGCEAAYHMICINPAIDSVLDEPWYCPKCAEDGRSSLKHAFENSSVPDGHDYPVGIQIPNVTPLPDDIEHNVSEHPSPMAEPPDESVEHAAAKNLSELRSPVANMDNELPEPQFLLGNENACKTCGVESTKSMISCSFCSNRFHLSCLRPPLKRLPRNTWYCPSCLCRVCKIDADDEKILLCDTCDEGYHTYCLNPPLIEKPKGAWFCPSCAKTEVVPSLPSPKQTEVSKRKRKSTEPRRST